MSLVPTWVRADDERWYKNPILSNKCDWFICFDDEDPPELVYNSKIWTDETILNHLVCLGLSGFLVNEARYCGARLFPDDGWKGFRTARSRTIHFSKEIPVQLIIPECTKADTLPDRECTFYGEDYYTKQRSRLKGSKDM